MRPSWKQNRWSARFRRRFRQPACRYEWHDCLCDRHEGVTDKRMSRGRSKTQARWDIEQGLR